MTVVQTSQTTGHMFYQFQIKRKLLNDALRVQKKKKALFGEITIWERILAV